MKTQNIDKDEILSDNKAADKVEADDSTTLSEDEIQKILSGNNEEAETKVSVGIEADDKKTTDKKEEAVDNIENKTDEAEDIKDDFELLDEDEFEEFGFKKNEEDNQNSESKADDKGQDKKNGTLPNKLVKKDSTNKEQGKEPDEKPDTKNVKPKQLKSEKNIHSANVPKKNTFLKKKGRKIKYPALIFSGVFIFVCLLVSGWFVYYKNIKKVDKPYEKGYKSNDFKEFKEADPEPLFSEPSADEKAYTSANSKTSLDKININLEKAKSLRAEFLKKQDEIKRLIGLYREDINKIQNEIKLEIKRKNIISYKQAANNNKIRLGLLIIQRNQAYIDKLAEPLQYLNRGSEELLYIEHQTRNDMQMYKIINGIELDEVQNMLTDQGEE